MAGRIIAARANRRSRALRARLGALGSIVLASGVAAALVAVPTSLAGPDYSITIHAKELGGGPIGKFKYLVNEDNTGDPADPNPAHHPGGRPTESYSPLVATGDQSSPSVSLPAGRYLITVQGDDPSTPQTSFDYKLWGKHVTLSADQDVTVELKKHPLPLPKLVVHVFHDNAWVNSAPDIPGEDTATSGEDMSGFVVEIEDQGGADVTVNHFNEPLCGGECVTDASGDVTIENLSPAFYEISVTPPDGQGWIQTSTFDGGFPIGSGLEEGSDGNGAPFEAVVEPGLMTAHWFGFVKPMNFSVPGTGRITGTARTLVEWPPFQSLTFGEPVHEPYVALSDATTQQQVWTGRGQQNGEFTIPNVPAGSYLVSIWDEPLEAIIRFFTVDVSAGQTVNLGDVGVSRWFGWLSGDVYRDVNRNGLRDPGEDGIEGIDMDTRWRDGSVDQATVTDATGHYEFPEAEGGVVGKFVVGEVGFGRFGTTGAQLHDEYEQFGLAGRPPPQHVPDDLSGGLLTNQFLTEAHRSVVDWGKFEYNADETGPIVGIVYHATTRNELDARLQAAEDYETGIPDATVNLYTPGTNGGPDVLVNTVQTDHWSHPSGCDVLDENANPVSDPSGIGPKCIEVPKISNETKDGAFDGGFAFSSYCPDGWSEGCAEVPLVPGDYIVEAPAPDHYQVVREEDVNVNDGDQFVPQLPPAPCVGAMHTVDVKSPDGVHALPDGPNPVDNPEFAMGELYTPNGGSPYEGQEKPLCDKRLVTLQQGENPEANFFFFADNEVAIPGRIYGLVTDDINFDTDTSSIWYGEARPIRDVPVGIRDYSGRLITTLKTDENGFYEVLLPSTQTANCPIPQGICPGLYVVVVNDPGDKANPNVNFNPNYLTAALTFDVWPGKTTQADTPLDPISGTACVLPAGQPEFFSIDKVTMPAGALQPAANRTFNIKGLRFGSTAPTLTNQAGVLVDGTKVLPGALLGNYSWSDSAVRVTLPSTLTPGPHQISVRNSTGGTAVNGITVHVLGTGYNPTVRTVNPPATITAKPLQAAIDAAGSGDLIVVNPGTYRENVVVPKRVRLQGFGPGGIVGAPEGTTAEDPRGHVPGTVIDGRYWQENKATWSVPAHVGPALVPGGADITVVAPSVSEFTAGATNAARIDGFGLTSARATDAHSAGGIYVHAYARYLNLSNNIIEGNAGTSTGGIALGEVLTPAVDQENDGIRIQRNRIIGNGNYLDTGGGGAIGIHNGADFYDVSNNQLCANFSLHYGGGVSQVGETKAAPSVSPPSGYTAGQISNIHDNQIYYNDAFDHGGGLRINGGDQTDTPTTASTPSGPVTIERNLIQANWSNDDGGGIDVENALGSRITIQNNMVVNNLAADIGGGLRLKNASNLVVVNNTVARNDTSDSCEACGDGPDGAGMVSEPNSPTYTPAGSPDFSSPIVFFNNIFWQNRAFSFDTVGQELEPPVVIDLAVVNTITPRFFCPRFSILTNPYPTGSACPTGFGLAAPNNRVGVNPNFVTPYLNQLDVALSRLSPAEPIITLIRADPPQNLPGNYHVTFLPLPGAANGGYYGLTPTTLVGCGTLAAIPAGCIGAPRNDYDNNTFFGIPARQLPVPTIRPDIGADEIGL